MQDLKQFFSYMNDVSFPYIVLRNWENLPYSVELGGHSDLDLLVYDLEHWKEIFPEAKQVYPAPRVQFKMPINSSFIQIDARYIGDGYYPRRFEQLLLETREKNLNGFYTPNVVMMRLAIAYHAVHHKNRNTYERWLSDIPIEELLQTLKTSDIGWVEPSDPTVGRFNSYLKGATSIVERRDNEVIKKQTSYSNYDLLANEERILRECQCKHFPKLIRSEKDSIVIEDCGELLIVENLPNNWKEQLVRIIKALRKHNIEHRDIRPGNLMVKDGIIKLIDFGWARFKDDPPDNPPKVLGYPYKPSSGWDDNFSMVKVIKEFEYAIEIGKQ